MARTPIWNMRLSDEKKARWQEAATKAGLSLAQFVDSCVEGSIAGEGGTQDTSAAGSGQAASETAARRSVGERQGRQPRPAPSGETASPPFFGGAPVNDLATFKGPRFKGGS